MKTLSKVIGIISYLPDELEIRNYRKNKLLNLIFKCNLLFSLPIIIVAQNYKDEDFIHFKNCTIYNYKNKLGITGARKELRKIFLKTDYDYLIMLDDDCELTGNSGDRYLSQIDENPGCFIEFNKTLLKLFAISKELFSKVTYDDINVEEGEGFEDRIFVNKLRKRYMDKRREFKDTWIEQHSDSTEDKYSTWYKDQDTKQMLENTFKKISEIDN